MERLTLIAALSFGAALCGCGNAPGWPAAERASAASHEREALLGGEVCADGTATSTIAILGNVTLGDGSTGTFVYCTGTLIAPDTVLVAAHCITETTAESILVNTSADLTPLLGADEPTRAAIEEASVPVVNAVANPSYDGGSHDHDVGLLFLERTIDDVVPAIVLAQDESTAPGNAASMVGYGYDEDTIAGRKRCGSTTIDSEDDSHIFTIGSPQGCNGDSGGGLFVDVTGAHARAERVAGVASFVSGNGCADFTAYAEVAQDFAFLDETMAGACDTRAWCDVPGIVPPDFYDPPPPAGEGEGASEGEGAADGGGDGDGADPPSCAGVQTPVDAASVAGLVVAMMFARAKRRRASSGASAQP